MNVLIAACGLDCSECPAYLATLANDQAAMEQVAAQWREQFHSPTISVADVICDGCMAGERHGGYCGECGIRKCVNERGLQNCAYCADYACEPLQNFFKMAPQVQGTLETIRQNQYHQ